MSAEYTPGPWAIFDLHDETRLNVRGPNEEFVADCADGFYSDETDGWVMAVESLPNARLIAAAPDLVEALRKCAEGWENVIEFGLLPKQHIDAARILADDARTALRKALGEGEA